MKAAEVERVFRLPPDHDVHPTHFICTLVRSFVTLLDRICRLEPEYGDGIEWPLRVNLGDKTITSPTGRKLLLNHYLAMQPTSMPLTYDFRNQLKTTLLSLDPEA